MCIVVGLIRDLGTGLQFRVTGFRTMHVEMGISAVPKIYT